MSIRKEITKYGNVQQKVMGKTTRYSKFKNEIDAMGKFSS